MQSNNQSENQTEETWERWTKKSSQNSGKEYGTALVTTDDDLSIITHTSKAMKLMTLVEHQDKDNSVGILSMMDEGASTVSSDLQKLNTAENKIDDEINDLAQYWLGNYFISMIFINI